jgi:hypothetical protein
MDAPQPERQPPTYWTPPDARWRPLGRWITWEMVVLGLALCVPLGWGSIQVVAAAWAACDEAEPPYLFGLLFLILPATILAAWVGFTIGAVLTSRWHDIVRYTVGAAFAVSVCFAAVTLQVPIRDGYDAQPSNDPLMVECGPYGIPTWWPAWLPS